MPNVESHRGLLMNVAYRLLGSVTEAEDAVQEAFARWYALPSAGRADVDSPPAWLVTATTRICLDMLGSARARRQRYVGEWLPEPVPGQTGWTSQTSAHRLTDPADRVSLDESLSMAMLVILETMTPAERVSFVLHDVFQYRFVEIAEMVGRSPDSCRKLASSARRRIRDARREAVPAQDHLRVVTAFKDALNSGDFGALVGLLDPAVSAVGDGGGISRATVKPITGAHDVARYLLGLRQMPGLVYELTTFNQRAGLLVQDPTSQALAVASVAVRAGRIERLWVVRNPDKLSGWQTAFTDETDVE